MPFVISECGKEVGAKKVTQGTSCDIEKAENKSNINTKKSQDLCEERSIGGEEAIAGRWTDEEHQRFLEAIKIYGRNWKLVQKVVGTRSATQARSHAQKYFAKLEKNESAKLPAEKTNGSGDDHSGVKTQSSTPISSPVSRPCLENTSTIEHKSNKKSGRNTKRKLSFKEEEKECPARKAKPIFVCKGEEQFDAVNQIKEVEERVVVPLPLVEQYRLPSNFYCPLDREIITFPITHPAPPMMNGSLFQAPVFMSLNEEHYVSPNAFDFDFGETPLKLPEPLDLSLGPSGEMREDDNLANEQSLFAGYSSIPSMENVLRPI